MRTRAYYWLWQYAPTMGLREWAWKKWLDTQWLKPAPHVAPRGRAIDRPTDETGTE